MLYGQLQYYCDELKAWARMIEFHKGELQESLRHISLLSNYLISSSLKSKEGSAFTNQLIVHEQQFDHLVNLISSQLQRLERTSFFDDKTIEPSDLNQQDRLRAKMKTIERSFSNTKYNCSVYLSSFLNDVSLALHV